VTGIAPFWGGLLGLTGILLIGVVGVALMVITKEKSLVS
jgi:hypothetical protein